MSQRIGSGILKDTMSRPKAGHSVPLTPSKVLIEKLTVALSLLKVYKSFLESADKGHENPFHTLTSYEWLHMFSNGFVSILVTSKSTNQQIMSCNSGGFVT